VSRADKVLKVIELLKLGFLGREEYHGSADQDEGYNKDSKIPEWMPL